MYLLSFKSYKLIWAKIIHFVAPALFGDFLRTPSAYSFSFISARTNLFQKLMEIWTVTLNSMSVHLVVNVCAYYVFIGSRKFAWSRLSYLESVSHMINILKHSSFPRSGKISDARSWQ